MPTEPESRERGIASSTAARLMTLAYMLMGALAVIGSFIPGLPNSLPEQATGSRILGLGALALGLAFHWLPWNRMAVPVQQGGLGLDKRASGTGGRTGSTGSCLAA